MIWLGQLAVVLAVIAGSIGYGQGVPLSERTLATTTYARVSPFDGSGIIDVVGLHAQLNAWTIDAVRLGAVVDCSTPELFCISTPGFRFAVPRSLDLDSSLTWSESERDYEIPTWEDSDGWVYQLQGMPYQINLGEAQYAVGYRLITSSRADDGDSKRFVFLHNEERGLLGYGIVPGPADSIDGKSVATWWTRLSDCSVREVPYNLICGMTRADKVGEM